MKPTLYLITITFLFSSCATILNRKRQRIVFYTQHPAKVVYQHDTVPTLNNKASIRIERKNKVANVEIVEENRKEQIVLYPHSSTAFWFNLYPSLGSGMLVDMWTPKMWAYPSKIDVNNYDSVKYRQRYLLSHDQNQNSLKSYLAFDPPRKKGELYFHVAIPFVNQYDFLPEGEPRNKQSGIWGVALGLDYYHSKNQFLSLNFVKNDDLISESDIAMDHFSSYTVEKERSQYVSVSNNHQINRLSIGYGLSVARNNWNLKYRQWDSIPPPSRTYANKTHYAFGFVVPVYFQLSKTFYTGLVYRPTIYRPNLPDKFKYEHTMSLDFAWKFRIKK